MDESPFDKRLREYPDLARSLGRRQLIGGVLFLAAGGAMVAIGNIRNMPALHRILAKQDFVAAILYVERVAWFDAVILAMGLAGTFLLLSAFTARMGLSRTHFEDEVVRRTRALESRVRDLEDRMKGDGTPRSGDR